jgi:hypothetical protein
MPKEKITHDVCREVLNPALARINPHRTMLIPTSVLLPSIGTSKALRHRNPTNPLSRVQASS